MKQTVNPLATIESIIARKRIIVCAGAGGAGKTTLAAAIAVRAARSGRRVVCLTIDPARRLADSLGVTADNTGEKMRDITDILGSRVYPGGKLSFGMLDSKRVFGELVMNGVSSKERADRILNNKLYNYISRSFVGMQEYMALEQLVTIRDDSDVELIVLDTPPTANAIDFFTAPKRLTEALDGKLVRVMRRAYGGTDRVRSELWNRWSAAVLKVLSRFTGAELLNEMMGFIDAISDLFGSFSSRAQIVEKVLHGNEVAFCLITTPDRSTLRETREFRHRLSQLGLAVEAVIFNRTHWPKVDDTPVGLKPNIVEEIRRLSKDWNALYDREQSQVEQVRKAWEGLESVTIVPLLSEGATRLKSLDHIGQYL